MEAQRFLEGFPFYSTLAVLTSHIAGTSLKVKGRSLAIITRPLPTLKMFETGSSR